LDIERCKAREAAGKDVDMVGTTVDPAQNPHQNIIPTTTLYEFKFFNRG